MRSPRSLTLAGCGTSGAATDIYTPIWRLVDLLWRWETPGAHNHTGDSYFRPCPYYVTSDGERAVVSSMGDIYCISPAGASIWHFTLPSDEALADKELSGFRLDDFDDEDGLAFEFSIVGMATIVSRIIASSDAILIGASDGRFFDLSPTGELREAHRLGESSVGPVVDADGALAAVAAGETIFRWEEGRFHRAAELAETPERVGVWRNGLWVQNRKQLDILDWTGKLIWSVEFSRTISGVAEHDGRLICAAGVLTAFAPQHG